MASSQASATIKRPDLDPFVIPAKAGIQLSVPGTGFRPIHGRNDGMNFDAA
jgi:hypothetical protein